MSEKPDKNTEVGASSMLELVDWNGVKVPIGFLASFAKSGCNCGCHGTGWVKLGTRNAKGGEQFRLCLRTEGRATSALARGKLSPKTAPNGQKIYRVTEEDRKLFVEAAEKWLASRQVNRQD